MKLGKDLLLGIEQFLDSTPPKTIKRGRGYFARGHVLELECVEPDRLYTAVVRGGEAYAVGLEFADGEWAAECSCAAGADCNHTPSVILSSRHRASATPTRRGAADER